MLVLRLYAIVFLCSATVGAQSSNWVPHEVIPPVPTHPDTALQWDWPWTAGDVDRDGYADFYMRGNQFSFTQVVPDWDARLYRGGSYQTLERWNSASGLGAFFAQPDGPLVFLRNPTGYACAFVHLYRSGGLVSHGGNGALVRFSVGLSRYGGAASISCARVARTRPLELPGTHW